MKKITRAEAISQGLSFYFTGKKCLRGNIAKRYTNGACACKDCAKSRSKAASEARRAKSGDLSSGEKSNLALINSTFR
ncbi:hypothetical protein VP236O401_P0041 [Vibrio phage 236O40-1]|nr:hypothetical protein VP236O401_P0041 [Vibrio phage 236O40-1]